MLSVLSQVLGITSVAILVWVGWSYSLAFDAGNPFIGGTSKLLLAGITGDSVAATFSDGVGIPELAFVSFQMTFAAITASLVVGSLVERVKFSAMILFTPIWLNLRSEEHTSELQSLMRISYAVFCLKKKKTKNKKNI